jgi:hypothetical protein
VHEAQAHELVEQAARVHVSRHLLGQRLEAGARAQARQHARAAAFVTPVRRVVPAAEQLAGGRGVRPGRRGLGLLLHEARHLAPVQAGGRGDAAHLAVLRHAGVGRRRGAHEGAPQERLHRRHRQAPGHGQARHLLQQTAQRGLQRQLLGRLGRITDCGGGVGIGHGLWRAL